MATADETLQATLSETEYGALRLLADSTDALSGRKVADALGVSPTTANGALVTLLEAGFVTARRSGRANLWQLAVSNPSISEWLEQLASPAEYTATGSSPYSTGGGGVRLEHSYAACLLAALLAGESLGELGDGVSVDLIRLQASDVSETDDIVLEGRDAGGAFHRSSIAVRRSPALTASDTASVPLIRSFLAIVTENWTEVSAGRWRLVLAASTNANALSQLADLAELARSLPDGDELVRRLAQPGRTSEAIRSRYDHVRELVRLAAGDLPLAKGVSTDNLTWRLLTVLTVRNLRLERTDRADRTSAVNTLQRMLDNGTPATADALFSRIEELVGSWAPQGAIVTDTMIRRNLSDYPLSRSARYSVGWAALDRLGGRLRNAIRPALRAGVQDLELERRTERSRLLEAMRSVGSPAGTLVVSGDPDIGKSALALRVVEMLRDDGATVASLSLRDVPHSLTQLESQLGGSTLENVMATGEVRPIRLILVDGAESVLEGKGQVFGALAAAAVKAGIGVVAVTRTDGSHQVQRELAAVCEAVGCDLAPAVHIVESLASDEREELAATFPTLQRLRDDPRAAWLLGRPGLVDVLLRTGKDLDPGSFLCEADVYSAVWRSLIRHDEIRMPDTASPDDREQAALGAAKRTLGAASDPPHGTASAELRSDGILRVPNDPSLAVGDEFSTDLFRDFALCRLYVTQGWDILTSAGAPRWSIRASRLGSQAALATGDRPQAWRDLLASFGEVAKEHGDRWLEVPYEALLTLGDADEAIAELWNDLAAGSASGLMTLLRIARSRYVKGDVGDRFSLRPIIRATYCDGRQIDDAARVGPDRPHEVIEDLVLAWLRGMATADLQPDQLRQRVRDVVLDSSPPVHSEFAVEALASLGPDIDDRAETWLRKVAAERPSQLHDAIESVFAVVSMSASKPRLLLDLSESFYIEKPDPEDEWGAGHWIDDGIRDFQHGLGPGIGVPFAAWYYGPFFRLLNTIPIDTIAFINRMLDHAAKFRVGRPTRARAETEPSAPYEGVPLDLPGTDNRLFIGDGHVWAWYRGTSVGPYACMSALLALERFIDHLLESAKVPAERIVELLVHDCHNLAVPGLLVGFLTRHAEAAGDLLDPFLASPSVWHLETARVSGDFGFRVRDAGADELTGSDRRRFTFHDTVGELVVKARLAGDEDRLRRLEEVGSILLETARTGLEGSDTEDDQYLAVIEGWAALFRIENYRATSSGEQVFIQFERPEPIEQTLAPRTAELQTTNLLYGLQNRYGHHNDNPEQWPVEHLNEDLATARRIDDNDSTPQGFLWPENPLVAVAAAAVRAHATGSAAVDTADLMWAAEAVLWAAENPHIDEMSYSATMFPMGADRAAAASAPLLLLAPFDDLNLDRERVENCLRLLATSIFDEVRAAFVKGCGPVWAAPCDLDTDTNLCRRHRAAWTTATAGLIDCRLGPWNPQSQQREPDPLSRPFHESLPAVAERDLMLNRLRMPLASMVDSRRVACLQPDIAELWTPLWDAHRRGLTHWWKEGYDHHAHITHPPIAERMIEIALEGDRAHIRSHIETCAADSGALYRLFDGFATVFTYRENFRQSIADFWPWAMEVGLDAVGDGIELRSQHRWYDYMTAALLPTPNPASSDPDIDRTLAECRRNWLQPDAIDHLASRWLHVAQWEPKAVDAVISLARGCPLEWQTTIALTWIEAIIDGRFDLFANRLWFLEEWLSELRKSGPFGGDVKTRYHRVVDGLAAAGDRAAIRLQQLDE